MLTTEGDAYFIELKVAHVGEACQLFAEDLKHRKFRARVICAKVPNPNLLGGPQKILQSFLKKQNSNFLKEDLIIRTSKFEEDIS